MPVTKHTPGPWGLSHVEDGGIKHLVPVDSDGMSLLTVVYEGGYAGGEVTPFGAVYSDADARLIAAAPELLSQLEFAVALLKPMFGHTAQVERMEDAIAKATGGTPCQ